MIPAPPKPETNARLKPQPPKPAAVESELSSTPRIHIPGAPDRGLTYPEAPDPNQTGIVNLRALIAPDGSVKEVIVLDGKRSLGMAAARAVRHWRYPPPDPKGQAMEAETSITFHFRGDDAVSVTFPSATPLQQN